jgi:hypothetical protein
MTILNLLIAAVLGIAAGFGTHALCPADATGAYAWGTGLIVTALTLGFFALRNSRGSSSISSGSRRINSGSGRRINTGDTRRVVDAPAPAPRQPARVVTGNFEVTSDVVEGVQKVTVTISGFSGSDWKTRVRPALDRVSSVKWEFPKNLKDGRRQMTGTVRGGSVDSAVAAVRSATARFSA